MRDDTASACIFGKHNPDPCAYDRCIREERRGKVEITSIPVYLTTENRVPLMPQPHCDCRCLKGLRKSDRYQRLDHRHCQYQHLGVTMSQTSWQGEASTITKSLMELPST